MQRATKDTFAPLRGSSSQYSTNCSLSFFFLSLSLSSPPSSFCPAGTPLPFSVLKPLQPSSCKAMGNAEMGKQESFARPGMALLARFVASLSLSPSPSDTHTMRYNLLRYQTLSLSGPERSSCLVRCARLAMPLLPPLRSQKAQMLPRTCSKTRP